MIIFKRHLFFVIICIFTSLSVHSEVPKRIIWILSDALNSSHLHYMGYDRPTSPWLDELAAKSVNFKFAIAPSDSTGSSVPAYFTGKYSTIYAEQNGVLRYEQIPESETTLAQLFQEAGFRTYGWIGNTVLSPKKHFNKGFDEYHTIFPVKRPRPSISEVIETINVEYSPTEGPELHYVHLMDTHTPFLPPMPFDRKFTREEYKGKYFKNGDLWGHGRLIKSNIPYYSEHHNLKQEDIDMFVDQYDGEIAYMDSKLFELLKVLDYKENEDLLIFASDHGTAFFEHGFKVHKKTTLLNEIHVPLIINHPMFKPASYEYPVSLLDLMPTLCEIFNLKKPDGIFGRSLVPDLKGTPRPEPFICAEGEDSRGPTGVVVTDKYFYWMNTQVHRYMEPTRIWPFKEYLFDLENDPGCMNNLIDVNADEAGRLNGLLRQRMTRFRDCTTETIRLNDTDMELGPECFVCPEDEKMNWELPRNIPPVRKFPDAIGLGVQKPRMTATANIEAIGKPHVFEISFKSERPHIIFSLKDDHKKLWQYSSFKPTKGRKLRAIIYPRSSEVTLEITVLRGFAYFKWPTLREAYVPEVSISWNTEQATDRVDNDVTEDLSPNEIEQLKALGYVD